MIQCSTKTQIIKEEEEAVLKRRVQEYWGFKIKGEWIKSYLYESSEFREKVNLEKYIGQNGRSLIKWLEFDILEIWTSRDEGFVKMNIKYMYLIPELRMYKKDPFQVQRIAEEKWAKKEGQWYRLFQIM